MKKYQFYFYGIDCHCYPYCKQCKNDRGAKLAFRAAMKRHNASGGYVAKRVSEVVDNVLTSQSVRILEV
mgnify:CR=1 FL=1